MGNVTRFTVMGILQAARARALGLSQESALSFGLNRACYSGDTYVLTDSGWKLHCDVTDQQQIMVYSPLVGRIWYEKPNGLFAYEYRGDMIHFQSKLADILVTPDHQMVYKWGSDRPWRFATAKELIHKRVLLPATADWVANETDSEFVEIPQFLKKNGSIGPSLLASVRIPIAIWLEFAGYYLSEGGMDSKNHYIFTLAQSNKKPENIAKIREAMRGLPFHSYEYSDSSMMRWNVGNKQLCEFVASELGEGHLKKRIPSWMKNLPEDQLNVLFNSLLLGDGTSKNGRFIRYYSTSKQLAYDFEEIAVKLGHSTNVRVGYEAYGKRATMYCVTLRKAKYHDLVGTKITTQHYSGTVYCFSTSTGFYVTMRNGKVAFQGNTFYAAAKRGFRGAGGSSTARNKAKENASKDKNVYLLGDDKAYINGEMSKEKGTPYFTIGGETQTPNDFKRQIAARFGSDSNFEEAWEEAMKIIKSFDEGVLKSGREFYENVYKPRRDDLARKWTEAFATQKKVVPKKTTTSRAVSS